MTSFSLPISILRQHIFCPRIPVYTLVRNLDPPRPFWVDIGADYHIERRALLQKNGSKIFKANPPQNYRFNVPVYSDTLLIHGRVDSLATFNDRVLPIEFKYFAGGLALNHKVQAVAYSLCLREMGFTVPEFMLISGKKAKNYLVPITEADINWTKKVIETVHQNIELGLVPESSASEARCTQCEFLNFCADRDF